MKTLVLILLMFACSFATKRTIDGSTSFYTALTAASPGDTIWATENSGQGYEYPVGINKANITIMSSTGQYDTVFASRADNISFMRLQNCPGLKMLNIAFMCSTGAVTGARYLLYDANNSDENNYSLTCTNVQFIANPDDRSNKKIMNLTKSGGDATRTSARFTKCQFLGGQVGGGTSTDYEGYLNLCDTVIIDSCYIDSLLGGNFNSLTLTNSYVKLGLGSQQITLCGYDKPQYFYNNYIVAGYQNATECISTDFASKAKTKLFTNLIIRKNTIVGNGHIPFMLDNTAYPSIVDSNRVWADSASTSLASFWKHAADTMYNTRIKFNIVPGYGGGSGTWIYWEPTGTQAERVIVDTTIIYGCPSRIYMRVANNDTLNGVYQTGATQTVDTTGGGKIIITDQNLGWPLKTYLTDSTTYGGTKIRYSTTHYSPMGCLFFDKGVVTKNSTSYAVKCSVSALLSSEPNFYGSGSTWQLSFKDTAWIYLYDSISGTWSKKDSSFVVAGSTVNLSAASLETGKHYYKFVFAINGRLGDLITDTTIVDTVTVLSSHVTRIECATCELATVQAAVDTIVDGDTLALPEDTCVYKSQLLIDGHAFVLEGAGTDKTLIIDSCTDEAAIGVVGKQGKYFEIKKIMIRMDSINENAGVGILVSGESKAWRIDSCYFQTHYKYQGITCGTPADTGWSYGLIDHNRFYNCNTMVLQGSGHKSWQTPLYFGTEKAVYIENNLFQLTISNDAHESNQGGRYVSRYNRFENCAAATHSLQNGGDPFGRASRSVEIYRDTFYAKIVNDTALGNFDAITIRGGTGVAWGNRVINQAGGEEYNLVVTMDNVRSFQNRDAPLFMCDGTNPIDGNTPGDSGWPCLDQIGRSTDYKVPNDTNRLPQDSVPFYTWDNKMDGVSSNVSIRNGCDNWIQPGRDYIEGVEKPGYTPYTYPHPLIGSDPIIYNNKAVIRIKW